MFATAVATAVANTQAVGDMNEPTEPQYEPATSFKWVIIAGAVIWTLGAIIIFLKYLL